MGRRGRRRGGSWFLDGPIGVTEISPGEVEGRIVADRELCGKRLVEIDPKSGSKITITGKVERLAGMKQAVTVTLSGLPAGIAVPKAALQPDQTEFKPEVAFPATFKQDELTTVRVFATGKMRPNAPIDVRSKELPLTISLTAKAEPTKAP